MKQIIITIQSAFFDFSRNKGRTILTSLGILIGVLAVVLLTAFGLGLRVFIEQQFESLGSNLVRVVPGKILQGGGFRGGSSAIGTVRFDEKDVLSLERVKSVKRVVPVFTKPITIQGSKESVFSDMYASTAGVFEALNVKPQAGILFTDRDVAKRSKVAVIGPTIAEKLFGSPKRAIGNTLKVESQKFRIIGVAEKKGGGFGGPDFDSYVYLPYKTAYTFNPQKTFQALIILAQTEESIPSVKRSIESTLSNRYSEDDFSVIEQQELIGAISSIFSMINTVLLAIAAISLVVGGIGIMNIMYVTVTERIKEIGIRRALGARKNDILLLFLIESVILSLLGGIGGLAISSLIVFFIHPYFPAYISLESVLLALGVSSAIGIIFGVFPAKKAADLSPIDAIRYE